MALFGREQGSDEVGTPGSPAAAGGPSLERRRDDASATSAFLGKGCRITGKVELDGVARIEGHVEGEVVAEGTLIVGESAVLKAKVSGAAVVVHGRIQGDVTARERLELRAPGAITGNVVAPSLVVHEGAVLEGQCSMKGAGARERPAAAVPPRVASAS
jgi:cytoskeletal protein CcmA (bactofilin family)